MSSADAVKNVRAYIIVTKVTGYSTTRVVKYVIVPYYEVANINLKSTKKT